jgi:uncharacterized membrane protein
MPHSTSSFMQATDESINWSLKKNCALAPHQMGFVYGCICSLSLAIGIFFWFLGATYVLAFTCLEIVLVGIAFLVYARHAADGDWVTITDSQVIVETERAGKRLKAQLDPYWVRIGTPSDDKSLIELSEKGHFVYVGRHIRPEQRVIVAKEIKQALMKF